VDNWVANAGSALARQFGNLRIPELPDVGRNRALAAPAVPRTTPQVSAVTGLTAPPRPAAPPQLAYQGGAPTRAPFESWQGTGADPGFGGTREAFASWGGPPRGAVGQTGQDVANFTGGGAAGETGFGALDQHNAEFNNAMAKYGAPANLLKAMVNRESSGDWARDGARVVGLRGDELLPFVGIFRKTAESWGLDFDAMIGNKQAQIDGMAKIMSGLASQYGGYDNAIKVYFGGPAALEGTFVDENGLDSNYYYNQAKSMWQEFDAQSGTTDLPTMAWGSTGLENNSVVQEAMQYVGVQYNWGAIPGAGQNPWDTGWDCSGMTYWLDQKYGNGSLRQGSHYQFQQMQQEGRLFTDLSQLQPGDLVFSDTGWQGGAGSELNRAGHVGIYIGNGQMLHAANPQVGTIVSPITGYNIIGAAHQTFSGGGGGGFTGGGGGFDFSANPYRHIA
jgi:hypothetical protein